MKFSKVFGITKEFYSNFESWKISPGVDKIWDGIYTVGIGLERKIKKQDYTSAWKTMRPKL